MLNHNNNARSRIVPRIILAASILIPTTSASVRAKVANTCFNLLDTLEHEINKYDGRAPSSVMPTRVDIRRTFAGENEKIVDKGSYLVQVDPLGNKLISSKLDGLVAQIGPDGEVLVPDKNNNLTVFNGNIFNYFEQHGIPPDEVDELTQKNRNSFN